MKTALITLSPQGAAIVRRLAELWPEADLYLHAKAGSLPGARRFKHITTLTARLFRGPSGYVRIVSSHRARTGGSAEAGGYRNLVYVAPCGVVVRAVAKHIRHKTTDPAVVVVDAGGRYAISLLSGHEGGANDLAVANILGAEPVISTTTEAIKSVIVGVGCRRGVSASEVKAAVQEGLARANASLADVRCLASADIKSDEEGLIAAARELGVPLRLIAGDEIRATRKAFHRSAFVSKKVGLPAVAEPAALLAGRRTQLVLPKTLLGRVTVAVARENLWS